MSSLPRLLILKMIGSNKSPLLYLVFWLGHATLKLNHRFQIISWQSLENIFNLTKQRALFLRTTFAIISNSNNKNLSFERSGCYLCTHK